MLTGGGCLYMIMRDQNPPERHLAQHGKGKTTRQDHRLAYRSPGADGLLCHERHPALSELDGFRLQPTFGDAEGFREIINLEHGFLVVLGDITCHKEAMLSMVSDASLKFHFRLEGNSGYGLTDNPESEIAHHTVGVLLHPEGMAKQEHYFAGQHERSVTLICESQFLNERFAQVAEQLPTALARFVNEHDAEVFNSHLLMRTDMMTAASAIMETQLEGALRKQYIESKALELLTLCLVAIIDLEANQDNPERGLTQRDIDCMHRAREVLEANYIAPPTIGGATGAR